MAFIGVICPTCGGQTQIEAGRSAMCPYCGAEMNTGQTDAGFAFAPQPVQQDVQFAQPPVQQDIQFAAAAEQPAVLPQMQTDLSQMSRYTPEILAQAQGKRKSWHIMNTALIGLQALMFAFSILLLAADSRFGLPLMMLWILSTFGFGAISGFTRPDAAYIEKKPFWKSRFLQGITQFWMGAVISAAVGAILFVMLAGLFGMF